MSSPKQPHTSGGNNTSKPNIEQQQQQHGWGGGGGCGQLTVHSGGGQGQGRPNNKFKGREPSLKGHIYDLSVVRPLHPH